MFTRASVAAAAIVLFAFVSGPPGLAQSSVLAITGATLFDGTGSPPISGAAIVINGGRIEAVGPQASVTIPAGATRIDATKKFLVPGLVDTNVHLSR